MSVNPTASGIGRFTALVLGLVVFVCVAMIGGTGYLKYQLDRAEITLAAPDIAVAGGDQGPSVAETRLSAQKELQFWAMLLTLACWSSLIIAAACAAGIYLTLRDKRSAPMRALAQSIQNMARGDMRTAIWGTERQDMIGELARAMDIARYHFSHMPDVSLLSEQGPVRLRFEGGARSLFEAMMKAISSDSENIRSQSSALTDVVKQQKESLTALSSKVESILLNITQRGQTGELQIAQAISEMMGSAENLKNAHAHATDQLNRLIPSIQDRAQGLAEITHIAGKQITQTLQSLTASDASLKANADAGKEALAKLSSTADDLGERLFGAINLLQASGKVMAETTENIKSRLGENATPVPELSLAPLDERLREITQKLASLQAKLDAQTEAQKVVVPSDDATAHQVAIAAALDEMNAKIAALTESLPVIFNGDSDEALRPAALQDGIADLHDKIAELADLNGRVAVFASALPGDMRQAVREELQLLSEKNDVADLRVKIAELSELNGKVAVLASVLPGDMRQAMREELQGHAEQNDSAALAEKLAALQNEIEKTLATSPELARQMSQIGLQLAAQIDTLRTVIDATLQQEIAGKLSAFEAMLAATQRSAEATQIEIEKPTPSPTFTLSPEIQKQFLDQWFQMSAQIEASRASLADALAEQIVQMENRLSEKQSQQPKKTTADFALQIQIEKQTEILSELIATLALLDANVRQIGESKMEL
jgi:predicted component of type VI protein secretion system